MQFAHDRERPGIPPDESGGAVKFHPDPSVGQTGIKLFGLQDILRLFWRRIWIIVGSVVLCMLVGGAVVFSLVPEYTASAYVQIKPNKSSVANFAPRGGGAPEGLTADPTGVVTEIEVLRSRLLAERAVEKLNLFGLPEFNRALKAPSVSRRIVTSLSTYFFGAQEEKRRNLASVAERERTSVVNSFMRRLAVKPQGRSRVMGIFFRSNNPRIAAKAANTIADLYIISQLEAKFEAGKRATAWLNDRITKLRADVGTAERAVEQFRKRSGLTRGRTNATLTGEGISDINKRYITEQTLLAEATARLSQAESLLKSPRGIETAAQVLNSPNIQVLRREENTIERLRTQLSNELGERHPRMIAARSQLVEVREKIRGEINKIIQSMRNAVAMARARVGLVRKTLNAQRNEVEKHNASEVQLRAMEREATASRILLEQMLTRSKQTASQMNFEEPDAQIITAAVVPRGPSFPKTSLLLFLLFALGTGIGVCLAVLVDCVDYGYRSADEIPRGMGVAALGLVPTISKLKAFGKGPQEYCIEHPTSAYAEALRSMYTNLLLTDVGNRPSVVLFASALPNEGKTSLVVSLARLLSSAGHEIVVVDCDLKRPSLHTVFGAENGPGLGEFVKGSLALDQLIQKDTLSPAHFIRAGEVPPNSADILDSVKFQQLLKTLSRRYSMVLLDSAPVLAVSDTLFLGHLANMTILLVRWATTRRTMADLALKKLVEARANVAGVLLSMVDVKGHAQYGYSDSGQYHGALKKYYTG
jgi:capsular exopolysaccharide synthesis family protein